MTWFSPDTVGSPNYGIQSKTWELLYVYVSSAKRYALFNLDRKGRPVLRKASQHGLGT